MKVSFKIIGYILIICLITELITGVIEKNLKSLFHIHSKNAELEIPDTNIYTHKIPKDYLKLLKLKEGCCTDTDATENKLNLSYTVESEFRNPISIFIYERKYYLQVYELSKLYRSPLATTIKENFTEVKKAYYNYMLIDEGSTAYRYKALKPLARKTIFLGLVGQKNHIILKNDSIVYYTSMFKEFSLQYSQTGIADIYGGTEESLFSTKYQPLEMIFLKRGDKLYLLIMSLYKENTKYSPGTLFKLIENK